MRLIDADALIHRLLNTKIVAANLFQYANAVTNMIGDAPTIEAKPVVRCRECKQGEIDDPDFPDEYYCHARCGWNKGDFYCAYGERKEGADNG